MPRPRCLRRIGCVPGVTYFKPAGIPLRVLEEIVVELDEVEALRLADLDGAYQEAAAEQMGISRPTFSRLIESAHRKVADALVNGKALRLEGGSIVMKGGMRMPGRDGTGPAGAGERQGLGRGPCGCGQARRARRGRGGAGLGRGGRMRFEGGKGAAATLRPREGAEQPEKKS